MHVGLSQLGLFCEDYSAQIWIVLDKQDLQKSKKFAAAEIYFVFLSYFESAFEA